MAVNQTSDLLCSILLLKKDMRPMVYPYKDERRNIRSNIPLRLKKFLRAKPEGTPEGRWVYLTGYPESSPNTDNISFNNH